MTGRSNINNSNDLNSNLKANPEAQKQNLDAQKQNPEVQKKNIDAQKQKPNAQKQNTNDQKQNLVNIEKSTNDLKKNPNDQEQNPKDQNENPKVQKQKTDDKKQSPFINPIAEGFNLNIWDLGATSNLHDYWEDYLDDADGVVFVVDVSETSKLYQLKLQLFSLLKEEKIKGLPLLILLNKQDKRTPSNHNTNINDMDGFYWPDQVG